MGEWKRSAFVEPPAFAKAMAGKAADGSASMGRDKQESPPRRTRIKCEGHGSCYQERYGKSIYLLASDSNQVWFE